METPRLISRTVGLVGFALVALPLAASAQGSCAGTERDNTPACNKTPAEAPFAPTGWKTVAMDYFTMQTVDYKKDAAYFNALMNWKVRSDDGHQAVLDIGNVGTLVIRGGYQAPPAPARPARANPPAGGGRGGGRGGFGQRPPVNSVWDSFAWQITPWDAKTVQAELEKRGLHPVADNDGACERFHVKDPDGFDVVLTNGCQARARMAAMSSTGLAVDAPFEHTKWKTVWLDHISFAVTNYKESVAWYQALLGWMPQGDEGSQNETWMCEDCGNIIIRGGNPNDTSRPMPAERRAVMNHISFGIAPFDYAAVQADLESRGLNGRPDTGGRGDISDPKALYKSYHTPIPSGWDLQISNATKGNRTVR